MKEKKVVAKPSVGYRRLVAESSSKNANQGVTR
jgi:hypothetical protein